MIHVVVVYSDVCSYRLNIFIIVSSLLTFPSSSNRATHQTQKLIETEDKLQRYHDSQFPQRGQPKNI